MYMVIKNFIFYTKRSLKEIFTTRTLNYFKATSQRVRNGCTKLSVNDLALRQHVGQQIGFGVYLASFQCGTGGYFTRGKSDCCPIDEVGNASVFKPPPPPPPIFVV
jgi:hypothetical protein